MRIIINSDDLGISKSVNDRTLNLIDCRRITSATLIANAPEVEDAIRRIPKRVNCSFGVHLNLTEFRPLTPRKHLDDLRMFLDGNGCFAGEEVLRSTRITSRVRDAFFNELRLQVETVRTHGVEISHVDSHNHVHTIPALFPVLKRLQKAFGIRKVRTTWNVYPPARSVSHSLFLRKRMWSFALRYYYPTITTCAFTSFAIFHELARTQVPSFDSIELMVHPGHPDFEEETQLLEQEWQQQLGVHAELISYRDL